MESRGLVLTFGRGDYAVGADGQCEELGLLVVFGEEAVDDGLEVDCVRIRVCVCVSSGRSTAGLNEVSTLPLLLQRKRLQQIV